MKNERLNCINKDILSTDLEKLAANALRALIHYKPSQPQPTYTNDSRTTQADRNRKAPPSLAHKAANILKVIMSNPT